MNAKDAREIEKKRVITMSEDCPMGKVDYKDFLLVKGYLEGFEHGKRKAESQNERLKEEKVRLLQDLDKVSGEIAKLNKDLSIMRETAIKIHKFYGNSKDASKGVDQEFLKRREGVAKKMKEKT